MVRLPLRYLNVTAASLLSITWPALAAKPPEVSWGRAGVTLAQYRADAISCGRLGANTDISEEPSTKAFVAAENWNERNLNVPEAGKDPVREQAQMVQRLRPAERLEEVQGVHVSATERCLTKLGYTRFALTPAQVRALGRLRRGTAERHAYLHGLASDPQVLAAQALNRSGTAG